MTTITTPSSAVALSSTLAPLTGFFRSRAVCVAAAAFTGLAAVTGCSRERSASGAPGITVFNAGAVARPIRSALDAFARPEGLNVEQESAGSLQTVRKITELHRVPDVVVLADTALFSRFLSGRLDGPVVPLGATRMVLAYTPRSRFAAEITAGNWYQVLQQPGVEIGRSDPMLDPAGYRAIFVFQLAERYYQAPGLASQLERSAPARNVRPKSADLVALLQTGNLDYAWEYESVARSTGLEYVRLPAAVDLGEAAYAQEYESASLVIPATGTAAATRLTGSPIMFGAAALSGAPHDGTGRRFITFLTSSAGRSLLARYSLEGGK